MIRANGPFRQRPEARGLAVAQSERAWPVENKLVGKDDKKSEHVGGIACVSNTGLPRACVSLDDELPSAQLLTVKNGRSSPERPSAYRRPA
jgi:hypothetical protein